MCTQPSPRLHKAQKRLSASACHVSVLADSPESCATTPRPPKAPDSGSSVCVCVLVPSLHALRTVSSAAGFFVTEHETFQHAARRALGLAAGDGEYFICMQEASVYKVGKQLRRGLFVTLNYWNNIRTYSSKIFNAICIKTRQQKRPYVRSITNYNCSFMANQTSSWVYLLPNVYVRNTNERMEYSFNRNEQKAFLQTNTRRESMLTSEQKSLFMMEYSINGVRNNQPEVIFCDAPARTSKTLREKIIAARLRVPRHTITTRREGCDMCGKYRKIAALILEGG